MGKPMSATPTPESMVGQGGADTFEDRCPTTPAPKGGGRGGGACITCLAWGGATSTRWRLNWSASGWT